MSIERTLLDVLNDIYADAQKTSGPHHQDLTVCCRCGASTVGSLYLSICDTCKNLPETLEEAQERIRCEGEQ